MPLITFSYQSPVRIQEVKALKNFLVNIAALEGRKIERLQYVFCSDDYLLNLNQSFLQHDTLTDIITFDLSTNYHIQGEVYISIDRVRDNSAEFKTTFLHELQRVIFHGLLHLVGYQDKNKSEITIMRGKEDHYLRLFNQK